MKKIKSLVCLVLILSLCLTGTGLTSVFPVLGEFLPQRITAFADVTTPSAVATQSFVPATESDIEFYRYYKKAEGSNNKAWYTDREGNVQYRIYGTPYEKTKGWYVADSSYEPEEEMTEAVFDEEYYESAPLEYEIHSQIYDPVTPGSKTPFKEFLEGNPEFANSDKTALYEEYELVWESNYNAPYLESDPDNVYGTKGAFALKRTIAGEKPIVYAAYGKILNDGEEGQLQWFKFTQNVGIRYSFTYSAGNFSKTIYGAAASAGAEIEPVKLFTGYRKPQKHVLTGDGDSWTFTYTANVSRLAAYGYEGNADKVTAVTYDTVTTIPDANQTTHSGYTLKYYYVPKDN